MVRIGKCKNGWRYWRRSFGQRLNKLGEERDGSQSTRHNGNINRRMQKKKPEFEKRVTTELKELYGRMKVILMDTEDSDQDSESS